MRTWIIIYFIASIFVFIGVMIYFFREQIRETYIKIRFPEKVVRICIHYPKQAKYKTFWRVIPDSDNFVIENKKYFYRDENTIRENDFFLRKDDKNGFYAICDDIKYNLNTYYHIKGKRKRFPEIHFIFNVPIPIDFKNINKNEIKLSASNLQTMTKNDQIVRLLTLQQERGLIFMVLIISGASLLVSLFVLAKIMEWVK